MPDDDRANGAIIRTVKDRHHPYVMLSRAPFEDGRLSWEARGLLAYLLSKPDGWQIRFGDLLNNGPGGRDRMRRMLHELQAVGYLARQRFQEPGGLFVWVSLVYEVPPSTPFQAMVTEKASPSTCLPSTAEPSTVEPSTAKASIYLIGNVANKESVNNERERDGAPAPNAPSLPTFLSFAPDDDARSWWHRECQAASIVPSTIPIETETAKWRDEIAAGRRPLPDDAAADWRQWMRRAIPYALNHPTPKEPPNGTATRAVGPGARTPGQPDPDAISDEQFREQLAAKLSGILVPPPA